MLEDRLIFIGMFGMIDPARAEVRDAVATAKSAGIRPIMITGDHPLTAMFIARELGIADENSISMIGTELVDIEASELEKQVCRVSVFARVSPEHKLRIVEALQNQGELPP
jgi:Ca2+-transporting ATPase